jgi:hypothetical protein
MLTNGNTAIEWKGGQGAVPGTWEGTEVVIGGVVLLDDDDRVLNRRGSNQVLTPLGSVGESVTEGF